MKHIKKYNQFLNEDMQDSWDTDLKLTVDGEEKLPIEATAGVDGGDIWLSFGIKGEYLGLIGLEVDEDEMVQIWSNGDELDYHAESELDVSDDPRYANE